MRLARVSWARLLLWLALPVALAVAFRGVRLEEVGRTLSRLGPGPIVVLALVNLGVVAAFAARWWVLLAADGHRISYGLLTMYRLAAFAISYFTPGTQFGGEPLQVYFLQKRHGVPLATATASIVLDRVLELMANFAFLALGMAVVIRLRIYPEGTGLLLIAASVGLLVLPAAYLTAVFLGRRPGGWILGRLPLPSSRAWVDRLRRFVHTAEGEAHRMARQRPIGIVGAVCASALTWGALLAEWWLATTYLGFALDPARLIAVVTATRLAFLVPVPGGLGALEASLILSLTALGYRVEQALGLALLIRVRDVAFGAVGLWLGGALAGGPAGDKRPQLSR